MTEATKISVRLTDKSLAAVDSFASAHSMNRTAVIEFFIKQAVFEFQRSDAESEGFGRLENELELMKNQLKSMQKANYRSLVFLCLAAGNDVEKFEKAGLVADKNVAEIFGE